MFVDIQQLEAVRRKFIDLSDSIKTVSYENEKSFAATRVALESLNTFANEVLNAKTFDKVAESQKLIQDYTNTYGKAIEKLSETLENPIKDLDKTLETASKSLNETSKELSDLVKKRKKPSLVRKALQSKPGRIISKEVGAVYGKLEGFVGGTLKLPTPKI